MSRKNYQQAKQKAAVIEQLKKFPIVQLAVQKAGVSRPSYYQWRKQDAEFAKTADEAMAEGILFINDIAEGNMISLINEKDMRSIRFWLTHRHPVYAAKLQLEGKLELSDEALSSEQQEIVDRALGLLAGDKSQLGEQKGGNHEPHA